MTTTTAAPLNFDKLTAESEFYGVKVAAIGEEGEMVAAFTHDLRRAIAAVRRYVREICCADMNDCSNWYDPKWVQIFDHCGCEPHEEDAEEGHGQCDCAHWGVPPCADIYTWAMEKCDEDAPNAIPVIEFEPSY